VCGAHSPGLPLLQANYAAAIDRVATHRQEGAYRPIYVTPAAASATLGRAPQVPFCPVHFSHVFAAYSPGRDWRGGGQAGRHGWLAGWLTG